MNVQEIILTSLARKIVFIQAISMRSYQDGRYFPLLDGNISATLHELYGIIDQIDSAVITIPHTSDRKHVEELNLLSKHVFANKIKFAKVEYEYNIDKTRESAAELFIPIWRDASDYDLIICDFENCYEMAAVCKKPVAFRFNVSKNSDHDIRKVANYFKQQLRCMSKFITFVLNDNQFEYASGYLSNNSLLKVTKNWFDAELIHTLHSWFVSRIDRYDANKINQFAMDRKVAADGDDSGEFILFPYRLTDDHYQLNMLSRAVNQHIPIVVTDPNESFNSVISTVLDVSLRSRLINSSIYFNGVFKRSLFQILLTTGNVRIPVFYDIRDVMHQTLLELLTLCPEKVEIYDKSGKIISYEERQSLMNKYNSIVKQKQLA